MDKDKTIEKLNEEVKRLSAAVERKDRENAALVEDYEQQVGHLQFLNNALTQDKQKLNETITSLQREKDLLMQMADKNKKKSLWDRICGR